MLQDEKCLYIRKNLALALNVSACTKISENIRSTLGPSSMNKILFIDEERNIITNDGATVLNHLNIYHPAGKILVEMSKSQDFEIGDGTTSVCILSCEILSKAKNLHEEGFHPNLIVSGFRKGALIAIRILNEISEKNNNLNSKSVRKFLMSCCATSLNSKLISAKRHVFSEMIVNICIYMGEKFDMNMISVKTITGGSVLDSFFIKGIGIKKPFCYAGSEKQFKKYYFPKILTMYMELELTSEKNSESKLKNVNHFQATIDAEWSIIYEKLDKIAKTGAKTVFSRLSIGDLSTQYFAERGILCGGRIANDDMARICKSTSAHVITSVSDIKHCAFGKCNLIEERQIGNERFLILSGCNVESVTIILRGASNDLLEETKRCLNDGMMIVKKTLKNQMVVGGAGSIEMRLSAKLRKYAATLIGQDQLVVSKYAQALEIIPKIICDNAGLDFMFLVSELRCIHGTFNNWSGIDIERGKIIDAYENYIWEPAVVKSNVIQAATEAACIIATINNTLFLFKTSKK